MVATSRGPKDLRILPFALFAALAFTIPYALAGVFLGPEFPSLLGGLVGLTIVTLAVRAGFLVPRETWDFAPPEEWPNEWMGEVEMKLDQLTRQSLSPLLAWLPYLLLAALLVASRTIEPVAKWLMSMSVGVRDILGEKGIGGNFQPLYLPGGCWSSSA